MTPQEFIAAIAPAAQASAAHSKIPASFTVAQAALESAWGRSQLAREAFNLFGVKAAAAWQGDVLELPTREYLNGQWVTVPARWRRYPDWLACIDDHAAFLLQNPRYRPAFQFRDGPRFASAVAKAGYATDPTYAAKIISIIQGRGLAALDAA
ncbi:glycoside hydrolase family 73 protein [Bordetella bronchialis]|uniref:Mannosyl-glycoprotein endo-beta-N-acetylglucosamidase n=1 Tax=Bordetella bronchialis TaxID=463025 RepID=A0A193FUB7_9BORD|nr:glucosaminidase domain-containing protein [Bordetella bronchialis]ANN70928.1 mannosyl-glycoprotein endo-beta-N-acetylglucosamidase [Bordetella bronchialis]